MYLILGRGTQVVSMVLVLSADIQIINQICKGVGGPIKHKVQPTMHATHSTKILQHYTFNTNT
jgi:hypothetical protein